MQAHHLEIVTRDVDATCAAYAALDRVQLAEGAGAQIALPRMELADRGTIAIDVLGGVQHGLWQL